MLEIQEEIKTQAKPGVLTGELYDLMILLAEKKGYAQNFMGVGDRRIRFTGHGLGLELDEFPFTAEFTASKLALCHLGNHCTCRKVLAAVEFEQLK